MSDCEAQSVSSGNTKYHFVYVYHGMLQLYRSSLTIFVEGTWLLYYYSYTRYFCSRRFDEKMMKFLNIRMNLKKMTRDYHAFHLYFIKSGHLNRDGTSPFYCKVLCPHVVLSDLVQVPSIITHNAMMVFRKLTKIVQILGLYPFC